MKKVYLVYDQSGYLKGIFENKKDAMHFLDTQIINGRVYESAYYKSFDEKIAEDPEKFIEQAKLKIRFLMKDEINVVGFKSKAGDKNGCRKFTLKELQEIVVDGKDNLLRHIAGFFDNNRFYEVNKDDFDLFVKAYDSVINRIENIKKCIKWAKNLLKKKMMQKKQMVQLKII